jgi:hypothetical protein
LTPKGRNETTTMDGVRRHDEYEGERQQRAWPQLGQKEVVS